MVEALDREPIQVEMCRHAAGLRRGFQHGYAVAEGAGTVSGGQPHHAGPEHNQAETMLPSAISGDRFSRAGALELRIRTREGGCAEMRHSTGSRRMSLWKSAQIKRRVL